MNKQSIKLDSGILDLITLPEGELIIASYTGEKLYKSEIEKALQRAGILGGYIDNSLTLLLSGSGIQLPIAKAYIEDEPAGVKFLFEDQLSEQDLIKFIQSGLLPEFDLQQNVKKDQALLEVVHPARTVLKYPDGRIKVLNIQESHDVSIYASNNTYVDKKTNRIYSEIEGFASRTMYGAISVFPIESVNSIGKAHGSVYYEAALQVESDIRSESDVHTISSLFVRGMSRASKIESGGNLVSGFGLDNPRKLENSSAKASQSLITTSIRQYKVWAGKYLLAKHSIENSIVQCLNIIAAPVIKNSEIRSGNKIYVKEVQPGSRFYLGSFFVEQTDTKNILNSHQQHEKRLNDIKNEINIVKDKLIYEKNNSLAQLNKLKRVSPNLIPQDSLLNRLLKSQNDNLNIIRAKMTEYKDQSKVIVRDSLRIAQYERMFQENLPLELRVTGDICAGTLIYSASDTLKLESTLHNVSIQVDPLTGKLKIHNCN